MYLVLSAFTSSPNSFVATTKASGELLIMPANGRWDLIRRLKG